MPLFITQASYSQSGIKGLVAKPEDRGAAITKMIESVGGKVVAVYMTTGDHDVLVISDLKDGETAVAFGMAAAASGAVADLTTSRAWTTAEFTGVAERAAKMAGIYTPPGG